MMLRLKTAFGIFSAMAAAFSFPLSARAAIDSAAQSQIRPINQSAAAIFTGPDLSNRLLEVVIDHRNTDFARSVERIFDIKLVRAVNPSSIRGYPPYIIDGVSLVNFDIILNAASLDNSGGGFFSFSWRHDSYSTNNAGVSIPLCLNVEYITAVLLKNGWFLLNKAAGGARDGRIKFAVQNGYWLYDSPNRSAATEQIVISSVSTGQHPAPMGCLTYMSISNIDDSAK